MKTTVKGNIITWVCCNRTITHIANKESIRGSQYKCPLCGQVGKSWHEINGGLDEIHGGDIRRIDSSV